MRLAGAVAGRRAATAGLAALALSGCGFQVASADLFVLTRAGPQGRLTLLVNDGGTIRCDGGKARALTDAALIQARDIADNLVPDAQKQLRIPDPKGAVYYFTVRIQQGTVGFPDLAGKSDRALAEAELFAVQSSEGVCANPGRGAG